MFKEDVKDLFIFREYENVIVPVDLSLDLNHLAEFIEKNEFPHMVYTTKSSFKLIFTQKIPTLLYFTKTENDPNIKMIR